MKSIRIWKKVLENDLDYIVSEMKEVVTAPAVIILSGPLGAGKTTFAKKFLQNLGASGLPNAPARAHEFEVVSPTYSLINEVGAIAHADFYRIKDKEELVHLEIPLYLENKDFFLVEWGRPHVGFLKKEVDEKFKFYDLEITAADDLKNQGRNFQLSELN